MNLMEGVGQGHPDTSQTNAKHMNKTLQFHIIPVDGNDTASLNKTRRTDGWAQNRSSIIEA